MEDIIQLKDQFYVLATSSLADQRTRVLKHEEAFAVFDVYGNVQPIGIGYQGLFDGATRFLSHLELRLGNLRPLLLSSTIRNDNSLLTVDMMNRDAVEGGAILPGTIHVFRSKLLLNKTVYERVRISNFGQEEVQLNVQLRFRNDFRDIFEIRGVPRAKRGEMLAPEIDGNRVILGYHGLDGVTRRTRLEFLPRPDALAAEEIQYTAKIAPKKNTSFFVSISCETEKPPRIVSFNQAVTRLTKKRKEDKARDCLVQTSNTQFNHWYSRSQADMHMMVTQTQHGPYPFAGVPLFNTVFGRDGLITAYQSLWVTPEIAKGVLAYLADTQATTTDAAMDAEPGKILHEVRTGEMVALGEVPFQKYYGSVDSTPLFLFLAGKYFGRTGDLDFIRSIFENLELALTWIDKYGDEDGDGFVEYKRKSVDGLTNQGWKDSGDCVFHANGELAKGSIALCEIQGYVYAAKLQMAKIYQALGKTERAIELREQAATLRENFDKAFWLDDKNTYALALDGEKKPCRVSTSNAGHCLFTGIALPERAEKLGKELLNEKMFSGWGIRTVSSVEHRYNPMSYHNGSIWPHDNSLIAEGLARYDMKKLSTRVFSALYHASTAVDLYRLPELYCGFIRRSGEGPTLYPVACAPQSWASASVFLMLKTVLGICIEASPPRLQLSYPDLPEWLKEVRIHNLKIGDSEVDFVVERHDYDVGVRILRRTGPLEVLILK